MIVLGALALVISNPAFAQSADPSASPPSERPIQRPVVGWSVTVGIAPIFSPAWQGSKDMALSIFPDLRLNYGDTLFASVPDGIGWNAINHDRLKAGPIAKVRFGRDEADGGSPFLVTGGSDALRGLGNVGAAAEVGGFAEAQLGVRRQWRVRGEIRRGFGGHEGMVADVSLAYRLRSGRTAFSVGPKATFVSASYTTTYFGIDAGQALRSGLAAYTPRGGLLSAGISGSAVRVLDRSSAVTLFAGFDRLGDEAGRSPLIEERGSRNQFTIGVGYGYRFNL